VPGGGDVRIALRGNVEIEQRLLDPTRVLVHGVEVGIPVRVEEEGVMGERVDPRIEPDVEVEHRR
jgi:hypothetical protein